MTDDLRHRPWTRRHDPLTVPERVIESLPCRFEELERPPQVGSEFAGRSVGTGVSRSISVVPVGVQVSDLACGWTSEDADVCTGLACEMRDDVATGVSGQQARSSEVLIGERPQGCDEGSMGRYAGIDVGSGLHLETLTASQGLASPTSETLRDAAAMLLGGVICGQCVGRAQLVPRRATSSGLHRWRACLDGPGWGPAAGSRLAVECFEDVVDHPGGPEQALDEDEHVGPEGVGLLPEIHPGAEDAQAVDRSATSRTRTSLSHRHHSLLGRSASRLPGSIVPPE